jgi:hypothetical protein
VPIRVQIFYLIVIKPDSGRVIYGKFGRIKKPAFAGFLMSGLELVIFLF